MSDPAKYRTREEVQKVREEKDPIDTLRSLLIEKHKISEKEFKAKDAEIKGIVTQASDFALESPEPAIEELGLMFMLVENQEKNEDRNFNALSFTYMEGSS